MRINQHPEGNALHHIEGNAPHCAKRGHKAMASVTQGGQKGFTLIEVLVAATILFLTLGTAMLSYQTAMNSSQRAAHMLDMLKVSDTAQQHIQKAIRDEANSRARAQLSGRTNLMGVEVNWRAQQVRAGAPRSRFDPDAMGDSEYQDRFFIYEVTMDLRKGGTTREFVYQELAWNQSIRERR